MAPLFGGGVGAIRLFGLLYSVMVLLKQSMTPLKVTAAALSVLVYDVSNSLCHFLKSQITFTSFDPLALTVHPGNGF